MSWNYRIIHHTNCFDEYYALHEVYYDEEGNVNGWINEVIVGDSLLEIQNDLTMMFNDTLHFPILEEEDLPNEM